MFFTSGRGFYAYNVVTLTVLHTNTYYLFSVNYKLFFSLGKTKLVLLRWLCVDWGYPPPKYFFFFFWNLAACRCQPVSFPFCPRLDYVPVIMTGKSPVIKCGYHTWLPSYSLAWISEIREVMSCLHSLESVNGVLSSEQSNGKCWKTASGLPRSHEAHLPKESVPLKIGHLNPSSLSDSVQSSW